MNRFEHDYYNDISSIEKSLKRIANALENNNKEDKIYYKTRKDMFMDNPCTKEEYETYSNVGTNPKNDPERSKFEDDLSVRYKDKIKEFPKVEVDFRENHIMCPDLDLRETARMYTEELEAGNFNTKKECILDYVKNEFGSHGARYTDIIKFAYYLGQPDAVRYSNADRGYYSCAISGRNAHLVGGGKDFLVKGINREGDERYFTHSFVESVTDYWKYI
jgi:hypothetical protein